MLDPTQITGMLKSIGAASSMANNTAARKSQSDPIGDSVPFLQKLQSNLAKPPTDPASNTSPTPITSKKSEYQPTINIKNKTSTLAQKNTERPLNINAPFNNIEEFKNWENSLSNNFPENYKAPDYIHAMGLSVMGGEEDTFKRYIFFKNNPAYAIDYEKIRNGETSSFPSDGSTLIKSDLSAMPEEIGQFYTENHDQLRMLEGFNMDPTLYKMFSDGKINIPAGTNTTEWLIQHKWTPNGIADNNNRITNAQNDYIGLDGKGSGNYRFAKYDSSTGSILDLDGKTYDPLTGKAIS